MELPNQVISDIKEYYPNQGNTHNHWSSNVNKGFMQQHLNSQWNGFIANIDAHTIDYLKISEDLLDAKDNIKILSNIYKK